MLHVPTLCRSLALLLLLALCSAATQAQARRLEVLFFGAPTSNGPHHDPITRYRTLKQALGIAGINLTYLEDPAQAFQAATLANCDAVLMYGNWDQHGPMHKEQLQALVRYVEGGGGFLPIHCASACYGASPAFVKLVGARFAKHGGEEFAPTNVAPEHPILAGLGALRAWDETYVHDQLSTDRTVLQRRDGEPWTWTRTQGAGRVFYTASGHDHRVWDRVEFQELLRNAIYWAVGPQRRQLLTDLKLPQLATETVSLPGYRTRSEITTAQKPLSAEQSQKLAQVPMGMRLQLFASEPDIVNPICINWDHRGRAFVIETVDYPNNLQANNLGHDRITICTDSDGDGRADRFTRFAERLSIPTSLTFANGGVLVTNGSELLFLQDHNGDDVADARTVLLKGFDTGDTHAGISNLRYGVDGWVYATIGYSGFRGTVAGQPMQFGQGVLRLRPDGSALEFLQNTTNNTWGLGFTEEFDIVGSTANGNPSWYYTFADALRRAAGLATNPTPTADDNPLFFPMSQDIRQVDSFDRYTSAAGHALYTSRQFPQEYWNRIAFVCEPTGKLVGQFVLERQGASFRAVQLPNNLYCSADAWSAPVCAEVGPDGAVWICDWYNLIVQHNPTPSRRSAGIDAKTGRGNAYVTPLRDTQHGRIWRVVADASQPTSRALDANQGDSLLAGLEADNLAIRLHSQRLLVERNDEADLAGLVACLGKAATGSAHALEALAQLEQLSASDLTAALAQSQVALRRRAIAHADVNLLRATFLREGKLAASGRELAFVLIGLAQSAADPELGKALFQLAKDQQGTLFHDTALREAWLLAARRQANTVLAAAQASGWSPGTDSTPVNLLPNSSFVAQHDNTCDGWTDLRVYGGRRDAVKFGLATTGRTDAASLHIRSTAQVDCGVAAEVAVQRHTRYRLSGWVKTKGAKAANNGPGMMLNVHGGQGTPGLLGDQDWTELSVEFDSGDRRTVTVHCLFGGYGGAAGEAWWDDVALVALRGSSNNLDGALLELRALANASARDAAPAVRKHAPDGEVHARGAAVYARTCIACHGFDGRGVPGTFPPLSGSDWLTGTAELPTQIVLHGLTGPITVGGKLFTNIMAPLGPTLSDAEIADVLTYVRQNWANDAAPVSSEVVARARKQFAARSTAWTAKELGR